jgi:hypothetical protein
MADDKAQVQEPTVYLLTTFDNPYDPFTHWDEWYQWDMQAGYHTPGLLARVARSSEELSDWDQHLILQQAMDEIVRENVSGMHRKIQRGDLQAQANDG